MVALNYPKYFKREDIKHYQIESIKYSGEEDKFRIILNSYFVGRPEINVSVSYYGTIYSAIVIAYIEDMNCILTSDSAEYIEDMTKEAIDGIERLLRGG